MKKFYNHLWTRYRSRDYQHCKRCSLVMNSENLKGNCMALHEREQAERELITEGKGNWVEYRGAVFKSVDIFLKVEEIRNRA